MALYFIMTTPDPMQARHTTQFLANDNVQISPLAFRVPRLQPEQTHLNELSCSRQSERPCKCARVVSGAQAGVSGDPSASDSQPDPVHA